MQGLLNPSSQGHLWGLIVGAWVVAVGVFFLLQTMPATWRKPMIVMCTFLGGLFYALEFFLWEPAPGKGNFLTPYVVPVGSALTVIATFSLGLGALNLSMVHARQIRQGKSGWYNSVVYFVAFAAMLAFAFWNYYAEKAGVTKGVASQGYHLVFDNMFIPLQATMFSVLAFFIVSAAYRAFRISTAEAGLMTLAAFVVMLGQVPMGEWITHWIPKDSAYAVLRLENIKNWILWVPNMSAVRAIQFGAAVGGLAMALRIWLSLERGAYFEQRV